MTAENLTEGDIFRWRYKDEKPEDLGGYRRYHCKSQIAVFEKGTLRDTYWGSSNEDRLDQARVTLTFQGNRHEMTVIPSWEREFYRHEDLVDMNHPNNSRAEVYVKAGAGRDAERMRAYFEYAIDRAKSDISSAHRRIHECEEAIGAIAVGDLTRHFPVYS